MWRPPTSLACTQTSIVQTSGSFLRKKMMCIPLIEFFLVGLIQNHDMTNSKSAFNCCFARSKIQNKSLQFCHSVMKQNKHILKKETNPFPKWQPNKSKAGWSTEWGQPGRI